MVRTDHPFWPLKSHLLRANPNLVLEYSTYVYRGYGITESRNVFSVRADHIGEKWLEDKIRGLSDDQELAVHSRVKVESKVFHVPMIDFVNANYYNQIRERIQHINSKLGQDIWIYSSGRSLHGYFFLLLEEARWIEFLGGLLLCNSRGEFPNEIVDSRWVGHSLDHGFSALRWSQNTERHRTAPSLLTVDSLHGRSPS
jgi:hypothetical protein